MKILLTGVSGQVGHALLSSLSEIGDVFGLDRQQLDLTKVDNIRQVVNEIQPNLIINPAAYTAVDLAEDEVDLAFLINANAPKIFAELALQQQIPLIHYSTDYVFDGAKRDAEGHFSAYLENDVCAPLSTYGKTKLVGEIAIRESHCNHIIFRTSWIYSDFGKNFLLTMLRLGAEREQLNIVNDQFGAPTSAKWLADITANIVRQSIESGNSQLWWKANTGTYHLTPNGSTHWAQFAQTIFDIAVKVQIFEKDRPLIHGIPSSAYPTKATRPKNSMLNTGLLKNQFNVNVPNWEELVQECLQQMAKTRNYAKEETTL